MQTAHATMPAVPGAELAAALDAAALATRIVRAHYGRSPGVTIKPDQSPVTVADVEVERAVRDLLHSRFPGHGFLGEETGRSAPPAGGALWIVDPIDGTRAFVGEYPMFSTQIALMRDGHLELGVSAAPLYGELAWAQSGGGAYLNDRPLRVSDTRSVSESVLSVGNIRELAASPRWERYGRLVERAAYARGYGEFLQYHLLAAGKLDIVIEHAIKIYDIAALVAIVHEAGGRCTGLDGLPVDEHTTSILATNGRVHDEVLAALN